jgi:hypothetical protein
MPARRRPLLVLTAAAALAAATGPAAAQQPRLDALFAPRARLWERWTRHDPASTRRVDHGAWARFLRAHRRLGADGIARIAYGAVPDADRQALVAYLQVLAGTPVGALDRAEQFAYWANLYNALTVHVVLGAYPVASIRDIALGGGGLFGGRGPWDAKLVSIEGEAVGLNDIEHRILRPIWRDARVHYAVNCASLGCPNLPAEPFAAATAEGMLDAGARDYVNHPRGVTVRGGDGSLVLSSLYAWFAEDFAAEGGVLPHLARHAAPSLAGALRRGPAAVAGHAYDWALNDATARRG